MRLGAIIVRVLLAVAVASHVSGATASGATVRYEGPMQVCEVVWQDAATGSSTSGQLDAQGGFQLPASNDVTQVTVPVSSSCSDALNSEPTIIPLQAIMPPPHDVWASGTLAVSPATTAVAGYLSYNTSVGVAALDWPAVDAALLQLYSTLGVGLSSVLPASQPPSTLQPLALAVSAARATAAMGIALLAAESQVGSYLGLGACLLSAASPTSNTTYTLELLSQQLFSSRRPGAGMIVSQVWVYSALSVALAAMTTNGNVSAVPAATLSAANATAGIIVSLAAVPEPYRASAVQLMLGSQPPPAGGLDIFDAVTTIARVPSVLSDACAAVTQNFGTSGLEGALSPYSPAALPVGLQEAPLNYGTILSTLGLTQPAAAQSTYGVATVVGPLTQCNGQSDTFLQQADTVTSSTIFTTDAWGRYSIASRDLGTVDLQPPQPTCTDAMTMLNLNLSLTSLSVSAPELAVSPITILSQGFYDLLASQSITLPTSALQAQAFAAVGLDVDQVLAVLPTPSSVGSTAYLAHPIMVANAAASVQLMALYFTSLALFMPSALVQELSSFQAQESVVSETAYAAASVASSAGGVLDLTSAANVASVFAIVQRMIALNSTGLPPDTNWLNIPAPNSSPPPPPRSPPSPSPRPSPPRPSPPYKSPPPGPSRRRGTRAVEGAGAHAHAPELNSWQERPPLRGPYDSWRVQPKAGQRRLSIYTDDLDFGTAMKLLGDVVVAVAVALQPVTAAALAAAAYDTVSPASVTSVPPTSSAASATAFNVTAAWLQVARTMVVLQVNYLPQAVTALQGAVCCNPSLINVRNTYASAATWNASAMAAAGVPVNVGYVCGVTGQCAASPPPSPPMASPAAASSGGGVSTGLIVGIAVAVGVIVLAVSGYLLYRCCSERHVAQAVRDKKYAASSTVPPPSNVDSTQSIMEKTQQQQGGSYMSPAAYAQYTWDGRQGNTGRNSGGGASGSPQLSRSGSGSPLVQPQLPHGFGYGEGGVEMQQMQQGQGLTQLNMYGPVANAGPHYQPSRFSTMAAQPPASAFQTQGSTAAAWRGAGAGGSGGGGLSPKGYGRGSLQLGAEYGPPSPTAGYTQGLVGSNYTGIGAQTGSMPSGMVQQDSSGAMLRPTTLYSNPSYQSEGNASLGGRSSFGAPSQPNGGDASQGRGLNSTYPLRNPHLNDQAAQQALYNQQGHSISMHSYQSPPGSLPPQQQQRWP